MKKLSNNFSWVLSLMALFYSLSAFSAYPFNLEDWRGIFSNPAYRYVADLPKKHLQKLTVDLSSGGHLPLFLSLMSDTSHGEDALTRGFLSTEVLFGWLRETRYSSQDLFALLEHMTRLELTSPGSSVAAVQLQSQKIRERVLDWIQEGSSLPQQEVRKYLNTRQWLRPQLTIWLRQNHTQNIFIENDPKLLKELKNLEIKNVHKWLEEWIAKNSDSPRAFERFYSSSKLFNILHMNQAWKKLEKALGLPDVPGETTAIKSGDLGQVLELLRLGASPEMRNRFGELPMHLALHLRNQELVELLIRYGGRLPSF